MPHNLDKGYSNIKETRGSQIKGILAPLILAGAVVAGIYLIPNKDKEIPNLGFVDADFKGTHVHAVDDDLNGSIDRVFGDGYLMFYSKDCPDSLKFKELYDPSRSEPLSEDDRKDLSKALKRNNFNEYQSSLLDDYVESGGL